MAIQLLSVFLLASMGKSAKLPLKRSQHMSHFFPPTTALASVSADDTNKIDVDSLRQHLPANLQNISMPTLDEIENVIKDKCIQAGGSEEAYDQAKQGGQDLFNCIQGLIDIDEFKKEVEAAKPTGDLDTVFNKYCRKRNTLLECVNTFSNVIDPCLEEEERSHKGHGVDVFKNLLNFVCHKDGDQIARGSFDTAFLWYDLRLTWVDFQFSSPRKDPSVSWSRRMT